MKHTLRALERGDGAGVTVLTKKPIVPTDDEVERNPRARSAKLRPRERRTPTSRDFEREVRS